MGSPGTFTHIKAKVMGFAVRSPWVQVPVLARTHHAGPGGHTPSIPGRAARRVSKHSIQPMGGAREHTAGSTRQSWD